MRLTERLGGFIGCEDRSVASVDIKLCLHWRKIASGKATCAKELSSRPSTVLIDMDRWMAILFPTENASVEDFVRLSKRLRDAMRPLVVDFLQSGTSVVSDFPANTVEWWM
jgi:predicted kinase